MVPLNRLEKRFRPINLLYCQPQISYSQLDNKIFYRISVSNNLRKYDGDLLSYSLEIIGSNVFPYIP
jgi:hypothetical protein